MTEPSESVGGADELEDGVETTPFTLRRIDTTLLSNPAVLRAVGGIVIGLAVLAWPNRSDRILTRLIGIALVWLAVTALSSSIRASRAWLARIAALAVLAVGVFLVVDPDRSAVFVGRLVGATLVVTAAHTLYGTFRSGERQSGRRAVYVLMAAIGALLIVLTEDVLAALTVIGAICWIIVSILVLVVSLDARTSGTTTYRDTTELVVEWMRDRPKSVDARQALYDKILYEGPTARTRIIRFFTLMGFAAVIASMGVITDSTAVVIGAMLIAPLMTPLMGMAISLVMGWPNRLARSAAVAFGGILFAIGIGVLLGVAAPTLIDTTTNAQILARSSPTDLDLIIAIAAGAAGAYGLSRPDVSDALPGVAIAISLVPPLTVVGIAYSQTDWTAGNGALLLFSTNMIAILLVGGLTFVVTGVTPIERAAENQHRVRTAVAVTCTAGILVFGALLINGAEIASNAFEQSAVESTIDDWLTEDSAHRLVDADIEGSTVEAVIVGPSDGLPDVEQLADRLTDELDRVISVDISLVIEERLRATGGS